MSTMGLGILPKTHPPGNGSNGIEVPSSINSFPEYQIKIMCSGLVGHHDRVPDPALWALRDRFPRSGVHPANKPFYLTCQSCQEVSDELCGGCSITVGRFGLPVKICDDEAVLKAIQLSAPEHFVCKRLSLRE